VRNWFHGLNAFLVLPIFMAVLAPAYGQLRRDPPRSFERKDSSSAQQKQREGPGANVRVRFVILYDPDETPPNTLRPIEEFLTRLALNGVLLNVDQTQRAEVSQGEQNDREFVNFLKEQLSRNAALILFHYPCPPPNLGCAGRWVRIWKHGCVCVPNPIPPQARQLGTEGRHTPFHNKAANPAAGRASTVYRVLGERLQQRARSATMEWWEVEVSKHVVPGPSKPVTAIKIRDPSPPR